MKREIGLAGGMRMPFSDRRTPLAEIPLAAPGKRIERVVY